MGQIFELPQKEGGIVFELRSGEHGAERFGRSIELGTGGVRVGQGPRIGLVFAGPMAVKRELVEQMRGRRCRVRFAVARIELVGVGEGKGAVVAYHGGAFLPEDRPRPSRPSRRSPAGGGAGL